MDNKQNDPRYKPRRWVGPQNTEIAHWCYMRFVEDDPKQWHWFPDDGDVLQRGDIFLPPDAPEPTEPPPDDIAECSTVDWLDDAGTISAPELPPSPFAVLEARLTAIEERLAKLEER
jgi:hypothetical protein